MSNKVRMALFVIALAAVSFSCANPFVFNKVTGSGNIVTEEIEVSDFDEIHLRGVGELIITQADQESLTLTTDDNLVQYVAIEVRDGVLEFEFTNDISFDRERDRMILDPSDSFTYNLEVIDLSAITMSGAASIDVQDLHTEELTILLSGAGDIRIGSLVAESLDINLNGTGDINLAGKVDFQRINLSGLGKYDAGGLESQVTAITIHGAGGADVWVHQALDVSINGAGNVSYSGDPSLTKEIYGLGRVNSRGE